MVKGNGQEGQPQKLMASDIGVFPEDLQQAKESLVLDFSLKLVEALVTSGDLEINRYSWQALDIANPSHLSEVAKADFTLRFLEHIVGRQQTEEDPDVANNYNGAFKTVEQIADYYLSHDVPLPSRVRVGATETLADNKGRIVVEPDEFVYLRDTGPKKPLMIVRKSLEHSGHVCMVGSHNYSELRVNMPGDEDQGGKQSKFSRRGKQTPAYILPQFVLWHIGSLWIDDIQAYVTGFAGSEGQIGTRKGEIHTEDLYLHEKVYIYPGNDARLLRILGVNNYDIDGFVMAEIVLDNGDVEVLGIQRTKKKKQI